MGVGLVMSNDWNMKTYMKGAAMLTIAAIIVKLLSAVYRVPFQNLVGDEGFYIYQQVYPFIGIITTWTSFGFAVALSKILSDYKALGKDYAISKVKKKCKHSTRHSILLHRNKYQIE